MLIERSINIELDDNISPKKINGKCVLIQVDEIAICRGRIIIDFSYKNDNTTNIQQLVLGVVQDNRKDFFSLLS